MQAFTDVIDDAERWDARDAGRAMGPPAPPKGLDGIEWSAPGRCLDVACGLGEQSVWAARRGFDVVALDVSPAAMQGAEAGAKEHGLADTSTAASSTSTRGCLTI